MVYRKVLLAGWVGILLCPGTALAEKGLQLDVSGGGSFERNPFLLPGDDTESAAVFVQFDPTYRSIGEVSTVTIGATLRAEEYLRRYVTNLSARLGLDASRRLSPTTNLRGRVAGRTSRTSALDFFPVPGSLTPATAPPLALPDVTFGGTNARTSQLEAGLGIDLDVSARDQISADLAASIIYFSGLSQSDFRYGSAAVNYRRKVSQQTSVSLSLRVGVFDYLGRSADDGITFAPTAGITTELGSKLTFDASAGVSVSRVKRIDGSDFSHVAPSLRAKMCFRSETGSTCANAARESQPTALSGLSTVTNFGVLTARRFNPKDEFSASVSYTLTSRPPEALAASPGAELLTVTATYTHDFNRRFAGFVTPSYTHLFGTGALRPSNPGVRIGLRYRFGGIG